jgi:hypothetical protein
MSKYMIVVIFLDVEYDNKINYRIHLLFIMLHIKNKNRGHQLKYNKMVCENMEVQTKMLYFK